MYLLGIIGALLYLFFFFYWRLIDLMLILVVAVHMTELVKEKSLQNKLLTLNLKSMPYRHLTPYLLLSEVTRSHKKIHLLMCRYVLSYFSLSRCSLVFANMAYFRETALPAPLSWCLIALNLTFLIGHIIKFKRCDNTKLYMLRGNKSLNLHNKKIECSICLLECQPN